VVDEMRIAATELKEGDGDKDDDEHEISGDESSDESDRDEWEEDEDGSEGRLKKKKFSSVDKVCMVIHLSGKDANYCYVRISSMQLLWISFDLKSSERRFTTSFESFASPRTNTSFQFAAWSSAGTRHMLRSYVELH